MYECNTLFRGFPRVRFGGCAQALFDPARALARPAFPPADFVIVLQQNSQEHHSHYQRSGVNLFGRFVWQSDY